jgi:hypothetical protein
VEAAAEREPERSQLVARHSWLAKMLLGKANKLRSNSEPITRFD